MESNSGPPESGSTDSAESWPFNFRGVDNLALVFRADLCIIALFLFVAVFNTPHLIHRLFDRSGWSTGLVLRSVPVGAGRPSQDSTIPTISYPTPIDTPATPHQENLPPLTRRRIQRRLPSPRIRSWSNVFHGTSSFLRKPAFPGCSIRRLMILGTYFGIVMYAGLYKSDPFSGNVRKGFVAMSQLPIVFALGTKNNIIGAILSVGYEKVGLICVSSCLRLTF